MEAQRRSRSRMRTPLAAVLGALGAFFLDPTSGRRRRAELSQRLPAFFRRRGRTLSRAGRAASAEVYGVQQKLTHMREEPKDLNDSTLTEKVKTELFRDPDVPKGQINVNVQEGVVQLRGEVPRPELMNDLVEKARSIQGVRDVENLLHVPESPAPMHE